MYLLESELTLINNADSRRKEDSLLHFGIIIFILYFSFVILFSGKDYLYTLYIQYDTKKLEILILAMALFIIMVRKRTLYLDIVVLFLTFRSVLLLIPYLYTSDTYGYWGNYSATVISILTYLLVINLNIINREKFLNRLFGFIGLTLTCQLILNTVNLFSKYGTVYKHLIRLPIGDSNFIAAFLVPCFTYFLLKDQKKFKNAFFTLFFSMGIFLTYSKGAIVTIFLMFIIKIILAFSMNKRDKKNVCKQLIVGGIVLILFTCFINYFLKTDIGLDIYMNTLNKIIRRDHISLNEYTSGRIAVYKANINRFFEHIFLGNGTGYKLNVTNKIQDGRTHNWIIELFVQSGVIGFFVFLCPVFHVLKRTFKSREYDVFQFRVFFVIISILIHGLVEPNLFSPDFDVLFWAILGVCETGNKDYYTKLGNVKSPMEN